MAGHEDRDALLVRQLEQQVADLDDAARIQPERGLVQDQEPGLVQQGPGDPQALGVAVREGPGTPVGVSAQSQALDDFSQRARWHAGVVAAGDFQVLADGQLRVGVGGLHQAAHFGPGFLAARADGPAQHGGLAAGGTQHAEQQADGGGLAGAVQSQEGVDLALLDAQVELVDGGQAFEAAGEVVGVDGGRAVME